MNQRIVEILLAGFGEITTVSALIDDPNSVGIIPPGEVTTNISQVYAKRPKNKFPYKITKNKKGTKVTYKDPAKEKKEGGTKKAKGKLNQPKSFTKEWENDIKGMFTNPKLLHKLLTTKGGFSG